MSLKHEENMNMVTLLKLFYSYIINGLVGKKFTREK